MAGHRGSKAALWIFHLRGMFCLIPMSINSPLSPTQHNHRCAGTLHQPLLCILSLYQPVIQSSCHPQSAYRALTRKAKSLLEHLQSVSKLPIGLT
eukprot:scaffold107245_cov17-Tisochrysis_lutea.AAC.1